jgi:hypothetical protein
LVSCHDEGVVLIQVKEIKRMVPNDWKIERLKDLKIGKLSALDFADYFRTETYLKKSIRPTR